MVDEGDVVSVSGSVDERFKRLYDVERHVVQADGGILVEDPYPGFQVLLDEGPVHEGSVRELLGFGSNPDPGVAMRPGVRVFSAFSFEACDIALRDNLTFSSEFYVGLATPMLGRTILEMVGEEHRRYRALAQPAFSPKRAEWWIDRWIESLVDEAVSAFEGRGRAELNAELCSRIPLRTITSSFGLTTDEALDFREQTEGGAESFDQRMERAARAAAILAGVIADRRERPQDDVITMLVEAELDEGGERHLLSDEEVLGFARLILTAGSGTTWRQLGILLHGLLNDAEAMAAVREDRQHMLRRAIDESVRWEATDPIFRRLVTRDVNLCGVDIPAGAVIEMNLGAANRDPGRWDHPEKFDIFRSPQANLGFAGGPHLCLGMHVARAEMQVAMNHVLDRLDNVRWDPDAPPARLIGLEHRGPNGIPVVWG